MLSRASALALALVALLAVVAPSGAMADEDPAGCPTEVQYDPTIPTFESSTGVPLGAGGTGSSPRNKTAVLYKYFDDMVAATANHPRVKVIKKVFGSSVLGRELNFYVIGTPENMDNLDAGRKDGPFWAGVRDGSVSAEAGLEGAETRPALSWITATPHGSEPAAGEAISRMLYELAARTDCWNLQRLKDLDLFLMPVRNPDGRDAISRTTAWAFDPNRDFGTQNQKENGQFLPLLKQYPGLFYIDAHQMSNGYFFPPNEDPVHHELSDFTLSFIQDKIGPALQAKFNDQSSAYRNYQSYDLFTPEYGDTVPSLLSGAAGMTFEKGTSEVYGKQVYDHYLAIDETVNVTQRNKVELTRQWVAQWQEGVDQGKACSLQPNKLVSPLHDEVTQEVPDIKVCGYFYRPDNHSGDAAELIKHMQRQGVHVYRFDNNVALNGVHEFGTDYPFEGRTATLPQGTLYIPMDQPLKHWIQAVLGEDPYIPFRYWYDVVTWSYSMHRGLSGNGFLMEQPLGVTMTEIGAPGWGTLSDASKPVYAYQTDSMRGLALTVDLLSKGVRVYRARDAFDEGGHHYTTGTALVDAASAAESGADVAALAAARETPVRGLDSYPVARYALKMPKVGLYTGGATIPNNPLYPDAGNANPGQCTSSTFCQALFTLTQKIGLPSAAVKPVTSADLAADRLAAEDFSVFINPNTLMRVDPNLPGTAAMENLRNWVNAGGLYQGQDTNGLTSARNAGLTTVNTNPIAGIQTPGSQFTGAADTTNPVAWGFDNGVFIWRLTSNPIYDPATLAGNGSTIPAATPAISYASGAAFKSLGFSENAAGLEGRPAVIDQPFGAGRAVLFGFDPFYRAWLEIDERMVLNALLYPAGSLIAPDGGRVAAGAQGTEFGGGRALPEGRLPAVGRRPPRFVDRSDRDVKIRVARRHYKALRQSVRAAKLPRSLRKRARYVVRRKTVTLVVRRARTARNDHDRAAWVGAITSRLKARGIELRLGQL